MLKCASQRIFPINALPSHHLHTVSDRGYMPNLRNLFKAVHKPHDTLMRYPPMSCVTHYVPIRNVNHETAFLTICIDVRSMS